MAGRQREEESLNAQEAAEAQFDEPAEDAESAGAAAAVPADVSADTSAQSPEILPHPTARSGWRRSTRRTAWLSMPAPPAAAGVASAWNTTSPSTHCAGRRALHDRGITGLSESPRGDLHRAHPSTKIHPRFRLERSRPRCRTALPGRRTAAGHHPGRTELMSRSGRPFPRTGGGRPLPTMPFGGRRQAGYPADRLDQDPIFGDPGLEDRPA